MGKRGKGILIGAAILAGLIGLIISVTLPKSERASVEDFEVCEERARAADRPSTDGYNNQVMRCAEQFAGRRKAGGGYSFYDFMQNQYFDLAGPNPNREERKQIDLSYMQFLGAQERAPILSDLPRQQAEREQVKLEPQPGPPLVLTPKVPLPVKRPNIERLKELYCNDNSLACSWEKLSAVVKNAFASSPNRR